MAAPSSQQTLPSPFTFDYVKCVAFLMLMYIVQLQFSMSFPNGGTDPVVPHPWSCDNYTGNAPVRTPVNGIRSNTSDMGTWMGNQWIPPEGWRLYSAREMQTYFAKHSILFVGDSLARRFYNTFYHILNTTDLDNIRGNAVENSIYWKRGSKGQKRPDPESCTNVRRFATDNNDNSTAALENDLYRLRKCRKSPGMALSDDDKDHHYYWDVVQLVCHHHVRDLIRDDLGCQRRYTRGYSIVLIATGMWEIADNMANRKHCDAGGGGAFPTGTYARLAELLEILPQWSTPTTRIVWRTNGYQSHGINQDVSTRINNMVRERFRQDNNLVLADWGTAMLPRSFHADRIVGDIEYHYGLEARLALIQILMNAMVEHDLAQKKHISHDG